MWLTHACKHTHIFCAQTRRTPPIPPPTIHPSPLQWRHWFGCRVCASEGESRGVGDLCETARRFAPCVCVCVCVSCSSLLAGSARRRESISHLCQCGAAPTTPVLSFFCLSSFFSFALSAEAAALPPPPLCTLCRQKAGVSALPHQVRRYIFSLTWKRICWILSVALLLGKWWRVNWDISFYSGRKYEVY